MATPHNPARQCKRKLKDGRRCPKAAILGGAVCYTHGGAAPQVKAKAAERLADLIDPDRALREAARLAYADIRQLYDPQGRLKPIKDWPDDLAAAIGGVEFVRRNIEGGDGHQDDVIKVKAWDKVRALEMLFKHLGLLKETLEHRGAIEIKWKS